jgi:hypothetical protein
MTLESHRESSNMHEYRLRHAVYVRLPSFLLSCPAARISPLIRILSKWVPPGADPGQFANGEQCTTRQLFTATASRCRARGSSHPILIPEILKILIIFFHARFQSISRTFSHRSKYKKKTTRKYFSGLNPGFRPDTVDFFEAVYFVKTQFKLSVYQNSASICRFCFSGVPQGAPRVPFLFDLF